MLIILQIERRLKDKVPELVQTYEKQLKDTKNTYQQLILVKPKMDQVCVYWMSIKLEFY